MTGTSLNGSYSNVFCWPVVMHTSAFTPSVAAPVECGYLENVYTEPDWAWNVPVRFNTSLYLATSGGTAAPLNYYEETTASADVSGAIVQAAGLPLSLRRVGKLVTVTWTGHSEAAVANLVITSTAAIPARFCPAADTYGYCLVTDNSAAVAGTAKVTSGGVVVFSVGAATAFQNAGNAGWQAGSLTYGVS